MGSRPIGPAVPAWGSNHTALQEMPLLSDTYEGPKPTARIKVPRVMNDVALLSDLRTFAEAHRAG